jgi:hypothetical protein
MLITALYVCMCVYAIMLIFVCVLCCYVYSVKSSSELGFIVTQKSNSNTVFLSYLILWWQQRRHWYGISDIFVWNLLFLSNCDSLKLR